MLGLSRNDLTISHAIITSVETLLGFEITEMVGQVEGIGREWLQCGIKLIIKRGLKKGECHIGQMLEQAFITGRIDDERRKAGIRIMKAANDAVHDLKEFKRRYVSKMGDIVDDTRKVIEDLHRLPG